MCAFRVLPSDTYILQLHFEQVHTTDSPFRVVDDPEPLPPVNPALPSGSELMSQNAAADIQGHAMLCPEPDCGETILLSDFNEHLELHRTEKLSLEPDEAVSKYHQYQQSNNMHTEDSQLPSFLKQNFNTELPEGLRRNAKEEQAVEQRKLKRPRKRGDSGGSEKSTLTRSILSFNPFARQKIVKPSTSSVRLGVSDPSLSHQPYSY